MQLRNKKEFTLPFAGRDLTFTVSDVAGQANASVIGQYGDTAVLVTVVMGKEDRAIDFFPLTVDYEERFYAAGKILGSRFVRREGRPTDFAVLSGRLIDRTIRPLFDPRLRRDVQVVVTILSYDDENDPDFIALATASLALSISDIPWDGPALGVRVLRTADGVVLNPLNSAVVEHGLTEGNFSAFFSGTERRINMIELSGLNARSADVEQAFSNAFSEIQKLIAFEKDICKEIGKPKATIALATIDAAFEKMVRDLAYEKLRDALFLSNKTERATAVSALHKDVAERLTRDGVVYTEGDLGSIWEDLINEIVHQEALDGKRRVDGRAFDEVRSLYAEIGLFKRLHGSALFMRGETQSLAVTTLAAPGSEQLVESMEGSAKRRFMLHYNFPPFSTGEIGRMGMPGRREIGHGALAEKALRPIIPSQEVFPYTVRVVSEILSSNGSSSMASVCAGTMALMDAGVPISHPVAGIAMGLMTRQGYDLSSSSDEFVVLTDIQGPEDHYGDMDLKIAGTREGITAIQMDVKVEGITQAIFSRAISDGQKAREHILEVIEKTIAAPKKELSPFAPVIMSLTIKPYQIGGVIGPGGKIINGMIEDFGLQSIDIDESGRVYVAADSAEKAAKAVDHIRGMTKEYEVGDVVEGPIVRLLEFGGIVDLGGGKDGMVHISEVKNGFVNKITDVLKEGQVVKAKVIKVDESGKIGLSIKALGTN